MRRCKACGRNLSLAYLVKGDYCLLCDPDETGRQVFDRDVDGVHANVFHVSSRANAKRYMCGERQRAWHRVSGVELDEFASDARLIAAAGKARIPCPDCRLVLRKWLRPH